VYMITPALNTPNSIIATAMRHSGKLSEGQLPTSEQFAMYLNDLNRMVNLWQTQGLKLWLQTDLSVTLVAGQGGQGNPYVLGPGGDVNMTKPLRTQQGYYLDVSGTRRPIYPLSWDEWFRLGQTTQQGSVTQYLVDKQATSLNVYTWLVPDTTAATGTMHLLCQQQVVNPTNLTDTMNFPPEWSIALVWGLADEISTGQPQSIMDRCTLRAKEYRMMLEDWDVEDAMTQFQPDQRQGGYNWSNFT
jgi:hypothetical protein